MEPRKDRQETNEPQVEPAAQRFQIHKLEERIAPRNNCHYNPHNKLVGCGKGGGYYYYYPPCPPYGCW